VFEDDGISEANLLFLFAACDVGYFLIWRLNCYSYDLARALRMRILGVSSLLISSFFLSSSLISKLAAGMIWKMALR
jgi:hypothetical protein